LKWGLKIVSEPLTGGCSQVSITGIKKIRETPVRTHKGLTPIKGRGVLPENGKKD